MDIEALYLLEDWFTLNRAWLMEQGFKGVICNQRSIESHDVIKLKLSNSALLVEVVFLPEGILTMSGFELHSFNPIYNRDTTLENAEDFQKIMTDALTTMVDEN